MVRVAVGKSCLLLRFCDDSFTPSFITTIGIDFKVRTLEVDGKTVKVQLWDTAGQERFRTITRCKSAGGGGRGSEGKTSLHEAHNESQPARVDLAYYRGAHGVLLVYDLTDRKSFEDLRGWADSVSMNAPSNSIGLIVGNKADMEEERQVGTGEATALAEILGMKAVETSAKSAEGVDGAFTMLVRDIVSQREAMGEGSGGMSKERRAAEVQLSGADTKARKTTGGCC